VGSLESWVLVSARKFCEAYRLVESHFSQRTRGMWHPAWGTAQGLIATSKGGRCR